MRVKYCSWKESLGQIFNIRSEFTVTEEKFRVAEWWPPPHLCHKRQQGIADCCNELHRIKIHKHRFIFIYIYINTKTLTHSLTHLKADLAVRIIMLFFETRSRMKLLPRVLYERKGITATSTIITIERKLNLLPNLETAKEILVAFTALGELFGDQHIPLCHHCGNEKKKKSQHNQTKASPVCLTFW